MCSVTSSNRLSAIKGASSERASSVKPSVRIVTRKIVSAEVLRVVPDQVSMEFPLADMHIDYFLALNFFRNSFGNF